MKLLTRRIIPLIVFVLWACIIPLQAQTNQTFKDKIVLEDGSVLVGSIQDYSDEGVVVLLSNGKTLKFRKDRIEKVKMYQGSSKINGFTSPSWYHHANFSIQAGNNGNRNEYRIGSSFSYSTGYRFSQYLSLGLGAGWDTYSIGSKEYFVPIYADITSFLTKSYSSPFFRLQAGASFSVVDNEAIVEHNGGWFLYPSFGWRLNGSEDLNYTLDFGFKMQKAHYLYIDVWGWGGPPRTREQDILFRRFSLRFGILF